jgi:hypothetical protein
MMLTMIVVTSSANIEAYCDIAPAAQSIFG